MDTKTYIAIEKEMRRAIVKEHFGTLTAKESTSVLVALERVARELLDDDQYFGLITEIEEYYSEINKK